MQTTQDKILQKQVRRDFNRFYVPVSAGHFEYFTRYSRAREFAKLIGAQVKPLE